MPDPINSGSIQRVLVVNRSGTDTDASVSNGDSIKDTYSAVAVALAPAVSATDIFEIKGSATKTVKVRKVVVTGLATAAGTYEFLLIRRSTANTVGTSSAPTAVPLDSADAAATAALKAYTANPTLGSAVGTERAQKGTVTTAAGAIPLIPVAFEWPEGTEPPTLRGVLESLCVSLNGVTMAGGSLTIEVIWTEE